MDKKPYSLRSDLEKARASALASLSMREHSLKELADKLTKKKYKQDSIDVVLAECLENNYLNDERFAEIYWRSRSRKGFGPAKIRIELKQKGISARLIDVSAKQDELDFVNDIKRVYLKKYKDTPITDFRDKAKRQNYLYQRGFDVDLIRTVIKM